MVSIHECFLYELSSVRVVDSILFTVNFLVLIDAL